MASEDDIPSSVTVLAEHTLQCADPAAAAGLGEFQLGPLDNGVLPFCPIPVIFVYPKPAHLPSDEFIPVEHLQQSLELLLNLYPQLTGRLYIDYDKPARFPEIVKIGAGALLLSAGSTTRLADIAALDPRGRIMLPNLPHNGNDLLAPFDPTLEGVFASPIFTVQHTRFACGGVALGITVHHLACDAGGFFQLVRDLSSIYASVRNGTLPQLPKPHIRSFLAEPISQESAAAAVAHQPESVFLQDSNGAEHETGSAAWDSIFPSGAPPVLGRVLIFSPAELAALKKAATGEGWVSTHEALVAHLVQRVYLARLGVLEREGIPPSEGQEALHREILSSINVRDASRLALPERYFPNAIYSPTADIPHDVLLGPLPGVAAAIHEMHRNVTPADMRHV